MARRPNESRRTQLLDQLEEMVLDTGFEPLRIGRLAEQLNCSRSTLYKLAPSKDELITVVFARYLEKATQDALRAAESQSRYTGKLVEYTRVIDEWRDRGSVRFWDDVRRNPAAVRLLVEKRDKGFETIRGFIEEGMAAGELRATNADLIAALVMGARPPIDAESWQSPHPHADLVGELARLVAKDVAA